MDYVTIPDVELVTVGRNWNGVGGPLTFSFDHLRDAMVAANEDPHIVPPRLKIGHSDPRFADAADPGHDPFYDGEPAIGSVRNLRLVNDGAVLIGDYVEVPTWLAEAMPSAFPSRSIEGAWAEEKGAAGEPLGTWDVKTPGGKTYSFVLTACALLGMSRPAVQDLEDLRTYLVEGKGLVVAGTEPEGGQPASARIGGMKAAPTATAGIDSVTDSFYADFAPDPDDPRYWWWVRDIWTDPNELIVDDEEGGLWKVPFSSDDSQAVSFTEARRAVQVFEDAPVTAAVASRSLHKGLPTKTFASAAESRGDRRPDPAADDVQRGAKASADIGPMNFTDDQRGKLRILLNLAEDATEEQIAEALDAAEVTETDEATTEAPAAEVETEGTEEEAEETTPAADASAPEDTTVVTVDRDTFNASQARLAKLEATEAKRQERHRASVIDAAVAEGKIMPSSKAAWQVKMAAEPDATEAEIGRLEKGLVPIDQTGTARSFDLAEASVDDAAAAYVRQNFPHLAEETV